MNRLRWLRSLQFSSLRVGTCPRGPSQPALISTRTFQAHASQEQRTTAEVWTATEEDPEGENSRLVDLSWSGAVIALKLPSKKIVRDAMTGSSG